MSSLRSRRRMRKVQPQTMRRHGCQLTGAQKMANNYRQGLFIDFTDRSLLVRDSTTELNRFNSFGLTDGNGVLRGPTAALTYTAPSLKMTMRSNGLLGFAPHNLVTYSEQLDDVAWTKNAASATANQIAAPNGTLTGDLITENTATAQHSASCTSISAVTGATYSAKIYIKAGTGQYITVYVTDAVANNFPWLINMSTGSGQKHTGFFAYSASFTGASTLRSDGWIETTIEWTHPSGSTAAQIGMAFTADDGNPATSASAVLGTSRTVYGWGAHIRRTPSDSTYLPTTTAARYALPYQWSSATAIDGILVEEARTNVLAASETFSSWTALASTSVTANNAVAPDGTTTADLVFPGSTGQRAVWKDAAAVTAASTVTISVFLKASGINYANLQVNSATTGTVLASYVAIDLTNGTLGAITALAGGGLATPSASVVAYPNGWYRLILTGGMGASNTIVSPYIGPCDATNTQSATADGTKGVLLWGAQVEVGAFATSYIPTVAASVTRAEDNISLAQSLFPAVGVTGTWFIEVGPLDSNRPFRLIGCDSGAGGASAYRGMYYDINVDQVFLYDGTAERVMGTTLFPGTTKVAAAFYGSTSIGCINGTLGSSTSYDGDMDAGPTYALGSAVSLSSVQINGHLKSVMLLPRAMSAAELQTLTR